MHLCQYAGALTRGLTRGLAAGVLLGNAGDGDAGLAGLHTGELLCLTRECPERCCCVAGSRLERYYCVAIAYPMRVHYTLACMLVSILTTCSERTLTMPCSMMGGCGSNWSASQVGPPCLISSSPFDAPRIF